MARVVVKEVLELLKQLEAEFEPRNARMQQVRDLRFSRHIINPPNAFPDVKPVRTRMAAAQLRRIVNVLTANGFRIEKEPGRPGRRDRSSKSDKIERSSLAAFQQMAEESGEDLFTLLVDHGAQDGEIVSLILYKPEHWAHLPEDRSQYDSNRAFVKAVDEAKKQGKLPIVWERIDPMTFYPLYGAGRSLEAAIIKTEHRQFALMEEFGLVLNRKGRLVPKSQASAPGSSSQAVGTTELIQFWTKGHVTFVVDESIIYEADHDQGMPFIHSYAQVTSSRHPGEMVESAVVDLLEVEPALDELFTLARASLELDGDPILIKERGQDDPPSSLKSNPSSPDAEVQYKKGTERTVGKGGKFYFLTVPTSPLMSQMIGIMSSLAERAGLNPSFRGESTGANEPGWRMAQGIAQQGLVFDQLKRHTEDHIARGIKRAWWLLKNKVKEPVPVFSTGVDSDSLLDKRDETRNAWVLWDPADIVDYQVQVTIAPKLPTADLQKYQMWKDAFMSLGVPLRLAQEKGLDITNAEEVIVERQIEDVFRLMPIFLTLSKGVMEDEGAYGLLAAVQEFLASQVPEQRQLGAGGETPGDRTRRTDAGADVAQAQGRTGNPSTRTQEAGGERRMPVLEGMMG